jgi:hypothetical protein
VRTAVGDKAFNSLLADQEQLGGLLSYHVVPKRKTAEAGGT